MKSLSLSKPHVIVMVGVPGAGKTQFADKFADTFQAPLVSSAKIAETLGLKAQPSKSEASLIQAVATAQLEELYKTHQTIVVDISSASRAERQLIARDARAAEYVPLFVWVQTDVPSAKHRATKSAKKSAPVKYSDELFEAALARFTQPSIVENPLVISGKHTYASQVKIVLARLVEPRVKDATAQPPVVPERPASRSDRQIIIR